LKLSDQRKNFKMRAGQAAEAKDTERRGILPGEKLCGYSGSGSGANRREVICRDGKDRLAGCWIEQEKRRLNAILAGGWMVVDGNQFDSERGLVGMVARHDQQHAIWSCDVLARRKTDGGKTIAKGGFNARDHTGGAK
jgi:hypothetical protein